MNQQHGNALTTELKNIEIVSNAGMKCKYCKLIES